MADIPVVPVDYTSRDFAGYKDSLLTYAGQAMPEWTNAQAALNGDGEGDFGVVLIELFAWLGDNLSYYIDRAANESYLGTATQRSSVLAIADLLDYIPNDNIAATGTVTFTTDVGGSAVTVPAGTRVQTDLVPSLDEPITFETDFDVVVAGNGGLGTVSVTQGVTYRNETVAVSDATVDQQYALANAPVIDGSITVQVGDLVNGFNTWSYIAHLIDATPDDYVFSTLTDPTGATWVVFGDGVNGRVPDNQATIQSTYRVGGGAAGNISGGQITTIVDAIEGVSLALDGNGVPQTSAMTGGADAESTASIRRNSSQAWKTQNRCVSLDDYAGVALGVSGVAKAAAIGNHSTSVTVFIFAPGGATPSPGMVQAVKTYLTDRAMVGTSVSVAAGTRVPVNVTLTLGVLAQYQQTTVRNAVTQALQGLLAFDNQMIGNRVSLSSVYRTIAQVPGVDYAAISNLARNDSAQNVVNDVTTRGWEIVTAGTITIASATGGVV